MYLFHRWGCGGQRTGKALRKAQLKMIAAQREANAAAHLSFWGAFTRTGPSVENQP